MCRSQLDNLKVNLALCDRSYVLLHWSGSRNLDPAMCVFFLGGAYRYEFSCKQVRLHQITANFLTITTYGIRDRSHDQINKKF